MELSITSHTIYRCWWNVPRNANTMFLENKNEMLVLKIRYLSVKMISWTRYSHNFPIKYLFLSLKWPPHFFRLLLKYNRYILPPFEKTSSQCFKTNTYQLKPKPTITQMYTHITQLYIAGNFLNLTNVVRISGREWVPTRPSHHLNLSSIKPIIHNDS